MIMALYLLDRNVICIETRKNDIVKKANLAFTVQCISLLAND